MSFNYARMKATADRLIASAGQPATIVRPVLTGPAQNPVVGAPISYPVQVVVESYRQDQIDGTRIQASDLKVLVAAGGLTIQPTTADRLVIGALDCAIIDVRPTNPGGTVVLWEVQARH